MNRDGESRSAPTAMVLKQDGTEITGTIGAHESQQFAIKKGTIDGNKVRLEVEPSEGPRLVVLDLTLEGDHLSGEAKGQGDDGQFVAKLKFDRQKE